MALYGTDIQKWKMVKAWEKTDVKESNFLHFVKKVPKCEIQTSSEEEADLSDYAGMRKTTREGESAWLQVLRSTQGTL